MQITSVSGTLSKSKAVTKPEAAEEATRRVKALLDRFVLYPELDLNFLQENY